MISSCFYQCCFLEQVMFAVRGLEPKGNVVIANQELDPLRQPGRLLRRLVDFHMLNLNVLSSGGKNDVLWVLVITM